jgi:Transmembrane protein 43
MVNFEQMFGLAAPELAENQESEEISYGEKMKDSCCGIGIGFILFVGCLGLSAWNEFRNVANTKTYNAARDEYKVGTCSPIMTELEGELVHVTCSVGNLQVLGSMDPVLKGIPENQRTGLSLESYMEVYQWDESSTTDTKEDTAGGSNKKETTYSYSRRWSSMPPDVVNNFHKSGETCKTQNYGYACLNWDPSTVESWWQSSSYRLGTQKIDESEQPKAGDYLIPKDKLGWLGKATVLKPTCSSSITSSSTATAAPGTSTNTSPPTTSTNTSAPNTRNLQSTAPTTASTTVSNNTNLLSCSPGGTATLQGNKMYWQQKDSNNKMIDYLSRSYSIRTTDTVSILAQQKGNSFVSWTSPYDDDYYVYEVVDGSYTVAQMIEDLEARNVGTTWVLRFLTLAFCIVGLVMITAPLATIPDIIPGCGPAIGDLIGSVLWAVDCMLGCCCWTFITAIAWVTYRPIVGIPLLCVSCCMCAGGGFLAHQNHKIKQIRLQAEAQQQAAAAKKEENEEQDVEVAEE